MDYEPAYSTVDCVVGRRGVCPRQQQHPYAAAAAAALLLLLCAEAVHASIHNGVSIQICGRFLLTGRENKNDGKKPRRFFGFGYFGQPKNRQTDRKKGLSVFGSQPCRPAI